MSRIFLLLALSGAAPQFAQQQPAIPGFVRGRLLIKFRPETLPAQVQAITAWLNARVGRELPRIGVKVIELAPGVPEAAALRAVQGRPEVEFAELDRVLPPADVTPNDPGYANWEWHLPKISAPAAWSTTTGSKSIVIAVIDTGVDGTHEDLAPKMVAGWNVYNNNSDSSDVVGHGTQVAGTAAAASNNGVGVASVAWGCWIMPIRISDANGYASYSDIASGIVWAADNGARVANVSYIVSDSSSVTTAARYLQDKGGVLTASAGNYGTFDAAADNPYVVTVSGTDTADLIYSWSNTGNNIDVAAPGCVMTTLKGGGYGSGCGTSFSAPIVAGVAALVLSVNPGLGAVQVAGVLKQSADDLGPAGWDSSYGWGRVNAARAVVMAGGGGDTQPPSVSWTSPMPGATVSGTVTIQASASDNVGVASVSVYTDGILLCTLAASPYACSWTTGSAANGSHSLTATAIDAAGNASSNSINVTVSNTADASPPTVAIVSPVSGAHVSGNVSVSVSASDNVGVVLVELYVDGALKTSSNLAPFTMKWNTRQVKAGSHVLQVKAYDALRNAGASPTVGVTVSK